MAEITIETHGLAELEAKLRENITMEDIKQVVRARGAELQNVAQTMAEFRGHYEGKKFVPPTGRTKGSITLDLELNDVVMVADVGPTTEYAPYLEYGTRYMEAQPFMIPASNVVAPKFMNDIKKLTK